MFVGDIYEKYKNSSYVAADNMLCNVMDCSNY